MAVRKKPSEAVLAAQRRRANRVPERATEIKWFIEEVSGKIAMTMEQRVKLATELVRDRVVRNLSTPVKRGDKITGGIRRSKPGEYPRADTTMLMKTIFGVTRKTSQGIYDGFVGTPLDYGLILETSASLNRSFLKRTFTAQRAKVIRILSGPIKS